MLSLCPSLSSPCLLCPCYDWVLCVHSLVTRRIRADTTAFPCVPQIAPRIMSAAAAASAKPALSQFELDKKERIATIESYEKLHDQHPVQQGLIRNAKRKFVDEAYPKYEKEMTEHKERLAKEMAEWDRKRAKDTKEERERHLSNPKRLKAFDELTAKNTKADRKRWERTYSVPIEPQLPLEMVSRDALLKEERQLPDRNERFLPAVLDAEVERLHEGTVIPDYPKFDEKERAAIVTWAKIAHARLTAVKELTGDDDLQGVSKALDDEILTATGSDAGINYGVGDGSDDDEPDGFSPQSPDYEPTSPKKTDEDAAK